MGSILGGSTGTTSTAGGGASLQNERRQQQQQQQQMRERRGGSVFQMPLHYPSYTRDDYGTMPEWKVDCLLTDYGLRVNGDLASKRKFAMGAFLWTSH